MSAVADPLSLLPLELQFLVLDELSIEDVARMRAVSRLFMTVVDAYSNIKYLKNISLQSIKWEYAQGKLRLQVDGAVTLGKLNESHKQVLSRIHELTINEANSGELVRMAPRLVNIEKLTLYNSEWKNEIAALLPKKPEIQVHQALPRVVMDSDRPDLLAFQEKAKDERAPPEEVVNAMNKLRPIVKATILCFISFNTRNGKALEFIRKHPHHAIVSAAVKSVTDCTFF